MTYEYEVQSNDPALCGFCTVCGAPRMVWCQTEGESRNMGLGCTVDITHGPDLPAPLIDGEGHD